MEILVPFAGFYNSVHDDALTEALKQSFTDRDTGCHVNDELFNHAQDSISWGLAFAKYAAAYVENFAEEFGVKLTFKMVCSPREYNFSTDRIIAEISPEDFAELMAKVKPEIFADVCREMFTSRSGFISFYSPDSEDWGDQSEWDHNQTGAVLAAWVAQQNPEFDQWAELALMETDQSNGRFDQWLGESSVKLARFWNIHDYLEARKAR